jgi:hypothetical protein
MGRRWYIQPDPPTDAADGDVWEESDEDAYPSKCPFCGNLVVLGVEVRGVYDGILLWECGMHHRWPRFPEGDRLHNRALKIMDEWEAHQ